MADTFHTTVLWFYTVMASIVFGAGLYEALVVHPAWSRRPPASFVGFVREPVSRMNIAAFWMPVAPLFALSALGTAAIAIWANAAGAPVIASTTSAVVSVVWTLVYFRPTIVRFLEHGGGDGPADELPTQARRWIALNWVRLAMVGVAWCGAVATLTARR